MGYKTFCDKEYRASVHRVSRDAFERLLEELSLLPTPLLIDNLTIRRATALVSPPLTFFIHFLARGKKLAPIDYHWNGAFLLRGFYVYKMIGKKSGKFGQVGSALFNFQYGQNV